MRYKKTPSHADKCLQKPNYTNITIRLRTLTASMCVSSKNYLPSVKFIFNLIYYIGIPEISESKMDTNRHRFKDSAVEIGTRMIVMCQLFAPRPSNVHYSS